VSNIIDKPMGYAYHLSMDKIETTDTATTSHYSDVLKRTGLTEKEAAVYETLLKNGQAGVNELTKEIPYKRGDLYNILYSLRDKGIIEQTIKNKKIQFRPMDPHKLKEYIVEQEQKYREADSLIDTVLPGLSEMFKMTTERPIVRVLEGYDGIKELYEDTLKVAKPINSFLEAAESDPKIWRWLRDHYVHRRVKAGIPAHVIVATDEDANSTDYLSHDVEELRETRVISKKLFPAKLEIQIYGNKVTFANYNKDDAMVGVIIDNINIAESMRGLFKLAWEGAVRPKPPDQSRP